LNLAYRELKKADEYLKEYVKGLEEMMYMTSHDVRRPVANIIGLTNIINDFINSPAQLKKPIKYLKQSAVELDLFLNELTAFIGNLEKKGKSQ
jgi:signal transduction histidine kinase